MNHFWLLVRADLMVEFLSKALFSGKYPRLVAIILSIFWIFGWLIYSCFKLFWTVCKYFYQTKGYFSRTALNKVKKAARKYGHTCDRLIKTDIGYDLFITLPENRTSAEKFIFSTDEKSGKLYISVLRGDRFFDLDYQTINHFTGLNLPLHQEHAQILYESLCCNWL